MEKVVLHHRDANHVVVEAEPHVLRSLQDAFTVYAPSYKFSPAYKGGFWDGKIRYLSLKDGSIYAGLKDRVKGWCEENGYQVHVAFDDSDKPFTLEEAKEFSDKLGLPFSPDLFQVEAFATAIQKERCLLVAPTASGKSLIAYLVARHHDANTLIVVPTKSLVRQLSQDFKNYGYQEPIHEIVGGSSKDSEEKITISTWQSVYKLDARWYERITAVIGDEAHLFKAKSLQEVMANLPHCEVRVGLTGSLDGTEASELLVEGLFGPTHTVARTQELVESGRISEFVIEAVRFKYPDSVRKALRVKGKDGKTRLLPYPEEMSFFSGYEPRNRALVKLAMSMEGATLLLFEKIEHGKRLHAMLKERTDRPVFLVYGDVELEDREAVRKSVAAGENPIAVASFGTFSTGIDMPNLRNTILGAGTGKSRVRVLQSIGRTIRKHAGKDLARIVDVGDDASGTKAGKANHSLRHFNQRLEMYAREGFRYRIHDVNIGEER